MSDTKPRRTTRESGRGEIASGEILPPQVAPIIAPEAVAETTAAASPAATAISAPAAPRESLAPESAVTAQAGAEDAWVLCAEMQAAIARGFEAAAVEMTGLTRSAMAAAADAATALLRARTLAEAVEINAGLICGRTDAMIEGSARLSEIGVKAATDASRPILARLGASWGGVRAG
jgi:hypothetical protein